jgi:hypothetical protein
MFFACHEYPRQPVAGHSFFVFNHEFCLGEKIREGRGLDDFGYPENSGHDL